MTSCFAGLLLVGLAVFAMVSLIRWFEQITEAVDAGWWNRVITLLVIPPMTWAYPSRVTAGRPTAIARHEPVRGFGVGPVMPSQAPRPNRPAGKKGKSAIDPAMVERLRAKMKQQGMLQDKEELSDDDPADQV